MRKPLLAACLFAFSAASCLAQDQAALEKGQKYLDKVAKVWSAKSPQTVLVATYQGNQYIGFTRETVTTVKEGFEVTGDAEVLRADGKKNITHYKKVLGPGLCVISVESTLVSPEGNLKVLVSVSNGQWTATLERGGKAQTKQGLVTPGTTWGPNLLLAFVAPDDADLSLNVPDLAAPVLTMSRLDTKEPLQVGDKPIECTVIETAQGTSKKRVFLGSDGAVVELQTVGTAFRMRPATQDDLGKDLHDAKEGGN